MLLSCALEFVRWLIQGDCRFDGPSFGWLDAQNQERACSMVVFCVARGARLEKTCMFEAPVAPDRVRHHLLGVQGPKHEKTLLLWGSLRAPTPQTHKKTGHKVSKRVPERVIMQQKRTLLQLLFSSSILKCLFNGFRREMYQKCIQNGSKNDTLLETTPEMENCVSTAPARADRGSDPPENHTKT